MLGIEEFRTRLEVAVSVLCADVIDDGLMVARMAGRRLAKRLAGRFKAVPGVRCLLAVFLAGLTPVLGLVFRLVEFSLAGKIAALDLIERVMDLGSPVPPGPGRGLGCRHVLFQPLLVTCVPGGFRLVLADVGAIVVGELMLLSMEVLGLRDRCFTSRHIGFRANQQ